MLAFHVKKLKKKPSRQPGQRKLIRNCSFVNLENATFHASAQFSPNIRNDHAHLKFVGEC